MLLFLAFLLLNNFFGNVAALNDVITYLPLSNPLVKHEIPRLSDSDYYCLHFTWLGVKYDNSTFHQVKDRTCSEFITGKDKPLCIDPMAVSFSGGKPNISYILTHHSDIATCKLSEDQVCAKYTIYYNGIPSHVARYCTRVDVESEGPMRSGCVSQAKGSYTFEVCACKSDRGSNGICNLSFVFTPSPSLIVVTIYYLLMFYRRTDRVF